VCLWFAHILFHHLACVIFNMKSHIWFHHYVCTLQFGKTRHFIRHLHTAIYMGRWIHLTNTECISWVICMNYVTFLTLCILSQTRWAIFGYSAKNPWGRKIFNSTHFITRVNCVKLSDKDCLQMLRADNKLGPYVSRTVHTHIMCVKITQWHLSHTVHSVK